MNSTRSKTPFKDSAPTGKLLGIDEQVLVELRRIIRAAQISAQQLAREAGLTTSQIVVLDLLKSNGRMTPSQIAKAITLTQATITILLDRLQALGLVQRQRGEQDRRTVHVRLTEQGEQRLAHAPQSLQHQFIERFSRLEKWEKTAILASLQRLSHLMNADALDAAPLLEVGAISRPAEAADNDV
jgi:DNA-binding MarR family transcriptional regulator